MDYKIARAYDECLYKVQKNLENEVNRLMLEGYKPQGGVSIATEKRGHAVWYILCQAMIRT